MDERAEYLVVTDLLALLVVHRDPEHRAHEQLLHHAAPQDVRLLLLLVVVTQHSEVLVRVQRLNRGRELVLLTEH